MTRLTNSIEKYLHRYLFLNDDLGTVKSVMVDYIATILEMKCISMKIINRNHAKSKDSSHRQVFKK